jgi:hypothetical protein
MVAYSLKTAATVVCRDNTVIEKVLFSISNDRKQ